MEKAGASPGAPTYRSGSISRSTASAGASFSNTGDADNRRKGRVLYDAAMGTSGSPSCFPPKPRGTVKSEWARRTPVGTTPPSPPLPRQAQQEMPTPTEAPEAKAPWTPQDDTSAASAIAWFADEVNRIVAAKGKGKGESSTQAPAPKTPPQAEPPAPKTPQQAEPPAPKTPPKAAGPTPPRPPSEPPAKPVMPGVSLIRRHLDQALGERSRASLSREQDRVLARQAKDELRGIKAPSFRLTAEEKASEAAKEEGRRRVLQEEVQESVFRRWKNTLARSERDKKAGLPGLSKGGVTHSARGWTRSALHREDQKAQFAGERAFDAASSSSNSHRGQGILAKVSLRPRGMGSPSGPTLCKELNLQGEKAREANC